MPVSSERKTAMKYTHHCTVHTTSGVRQHMQEGGEIAMDEWERFTVFLTAFDFNTECISDRRRRWLTNSYCDLGACRSPGGEDRNYASEPFTLSHQQTTSVSLPSPRAAAATAGRRQAGRRGFSVQDCASVWILLNPLGFRNIKKKKTHKTRSRIRSSG